MAKGGEVMSYAEGGMAESSDYASNMKRAFGYEPFHGPTVQKYMGGGQVRHFDTGDFVNDPMGSGSAEIIDTDKIPSGLSDFRQWFMRQTGNPQWKIDEANKKALEEDTKNKAAQSAPVKKSNSTSKPLNKYDPSMRGPSQQDIIDQRAAELASQQANLPIEGISDQAESNDPTASQEAQTAAGLASVNPLASKTPSAKGDVADAGSDDYANYFAGLKTQEEALAKQRKEDKALSLMMTGAAIAAGESPNAFTNVGKGVAFGLGHYADARKQNAMEEARINQAKGTGLRYKTERDYQKDALAQRKDYQEDLIELRRLQEKDNKTKADEALAVKKEADVEKKRNNMMHSLTEYQKMVMSGPEAEYKAELASAAKLVLPEQQAEAAAKAEAKLAQARAKLERDPIVMQHRKTINPSIDWDEVVKRTTAPSFEGFSATPVKKGK
jgi:hypothetical protein